MMGLSGGKRTKTFSHFYTKHACDTQTDTGTHRHYYY